MTQSMPTFASPSLPDSFDVPSCAPQPDSMKKTQPRWKFGKETRDQAKKVFLSKDHETDCLGRWSPGPVYTPKERLSAPKWSFSKSIGKAVFKEKYPATSADLTFQSFDAQELLFDRGARPVLGTESRDSCKNQPDLETFIAGADSPGPQAYNPDDKRGMGPSYTVRAKVKWGEQIIQTPPGVGPNKYPTPVAVGRQASSMRKTLPNWSFGRAERFPRNRDRAGAEAPLRDGTGALALKYGRGGISPSIGFGTSTRDMRTRLGYMQVEKDKGPSAAFPKPHEQHPMLDTRKQILRYSGPQAP